MITPTPMQGTFQPILCIETSTRLTAIFNIYHSPTTEDEAANKLLKKNNQLKIVVTTKKNKLWRKNNS